MTSEKGKISKKGLIFIASLTTAMSIYCWLDYIYNFNSDFNARPGASLIFAIIMSSLSVIEFIEAFLIKRDRKILRYIGYLFLIPLIPMLIVGILSQTKLLASLTLPLMVLTLLIPISTYSYHQLELLQLGENFNKSVIPYLNLSTITIVFIYSDKLLVKLLARFIPDDQMPQLVKDATYELLDKRPFVKIAYLFLTALFIIATIEQLSKKEFLHFLGSYKSVALESLVTFAAVDQMVDKWKSKKKT